MRYSPLGKTDLNVSKICLGTMTWGEQNNQEQAFSQMDMAVDAGINFFDAAEMYPVPPKPETQGSTEAILGNWLESRKSRDKIIVATKVTGRSENFRHVRNGELPILDKKNIEYALENSLKRLKTDYIDLYQIHWPDRETNTFGTLSYKHNPNDKFIPLEETLSVLENLRKQGKIRHIGLSNETPWGVFDSLRACDKNDFLHPVSIQNPYNLLNRSFEVGLSEIAIRENIGLLAYSPLAFGVLTGKYLEGKPKNSRLALYARFQRYNNPKAEEATKRYVRIAKDAGLLPSQMALAFINSRDFVTSNIIGATNLDQLKENISSININLRFDVLEAIEKVQNDIPNPCP